MKKHLVTAVLYTFVTAILLGIVYPLAVTGISHVLFAKQADGSLIVSHGQVVGSKLIGQSFTGAEYFHSRPSQARGMSRERLRVQTSRLRVKR
jgi:K+-transporting ATPase ATPase C chain